MFNAPFQINRPQIRDTSVVFASPHSGRNYSKGFLHSTVLNEMEIRSSEDAFVDHLFRDVPSFGAPLLLATTPRAYVDLNRNIDELDPALIDEVKKTFHNPRVASGLGVIPRVVSHGRAIYNGKMPRSAAEARLLAHWAPYHAALEGLLAESHEMFGQAILIDCHSMPHEAINRPTRRGVPKPQIVLGDRFGTAANTEIVDRIEAGFVKAGLTVARNTPFAGAFITQQYGRPSRGRHAIQIEIDRSLYMDEKLIQPNADFVAFQAVISSVAKGIVAIGRSDCAVAAE